MAKAKYQLDDFLAIVNDRDRDFVLAIHNMLVEKGYKLKVQVTKTYGLHIAYAQPKIKTVKGIIAYFLVQAGKLMMRVNADHLSQYPQILDRLPESMVSQIADASDCLKIKDPQKCWQGCMGYAFEIRGRQYGKCICNCFMLNVNGDSYPFLVEMLEQEAARRGVGR
jgi:hypothetical protein